MSSALIDIVSAAAALSLAAIAAYVDVKTLKIPNRITFPAIAAGLVLGAIRCLTGYSILELALTLAISWAFVYAIWVAGLWGGGDAKAVLALSLLLSPMYPPLSFVVAFLISTAVSLFIRESIFLMTRAFRVRDPVSMALALSPASAAALLFLLSTGIGLIMASLLALLALAVVADLLSTFLPRYEKALLGPSSEMRLAGRRPAEDIYLKEEGPVRILRPAGMLGPFLRGTIREKTPPLIPRRRSGLLPEDIRLLKRHLSFIYIVPQHPMGPLLFVSLIASLTSLYVVSLPEVSALL